ncbi:MAG: hypothetical protein JRH18_04575 [Deltaproteobacteria bacterium]|nr:hypothetical protein [Deltaproteobacteria bacterium]MBW1992824.1 hypothetical protein [Deltaproteobacteria bacterium]MBW2150920.1 hypothetical protein [Deltaproteobacteria bacterium]
MYRNRPIFMISLWAAAMMVVLVYISCGLKKVVPEQPAEPFKFSRLIFLPIQDMARIYGENKTIQCQLCGNMFTTGRVTEGADAFLTHHVQALLKERRKDFELVPISQAKGAMSDILLGSQQELSERELLVKIGRQLNADAILTGKVYRFVERNGTDYSTNSPASVAFDLTLLRVSDGRIMWTGHYDETQQSLFENIFKLNSFFKREGKWITAEALALEGLKKIFEEFPVHEDNTGSGH